MMTRHRAPFKDPTGLTPGPALCQGPGSSEAFVPRAVGIGAEGQYSAALLSHFARSAPHRKIRVRNPAGKIPKEVLRSRAARLGLAARSASVIAGNRGRGRRRLFET